MPIHPPTHYVKHYADHFTLCGLHTDRALPPAAHDVSVMVSFVTCAHCQRLLRVTGVALYPAIIKTPKGE